MFIRVLISITITFLSAAILKTHTPQAKPPIVSSPSEVTRTVEAIVGIWKGPLNANVPGSPPGSIDWTMDCKRVALNSGALCTNGGTAPSENWQNRVCLHLIRKVKLCITCA